MTTEVTHQVDRLASLVDNSVSHLSTDNQSAIVVRQASSSTSSQSVPPGPIESSSSATDSHTTSTTSPTVYQSSSSSSTSSSSSSSSGESGVSFSNQTELDFIVEDTYSDSSNKRDDQSNSELNNCVKLKKRRMGTGLDFFNDSGVPMELDSSTNAEREVNEYARIASTTNPISATSSIATTGTVNATLILGNQPGSNNEAVASIRSAMNIAEDNKFGPNCGHDFGTSSGGGSGANDSVRNLGASWDSSETHCNSDLDDMPQALNPMNRENQTNNDSRHGIRGFGELFDDDDLD